MIFVGLITFLVPLSLGLGAGGFSSADTLTQFSWYFMTAGGFLFLLFILIQTASIITEGDKLYGSSILFASPGETPALPFFKRFTQVQLVWLSTIIFGWIGLFSVTSQTTFTGLLSLEQQFTKTAQLLFSLSLIPSSENLGLAFVLGFSLLLLRFIARRTKMSKENYRLIALIVLPFIGMFYWYVNHLLRYQGQDIDLLIVLGFGYVQSLLTVITGSFIIGWIFHSLNNFFFDLKNLFSSDIVLTNSILILIVIMGLYWFFYRGRIFGDKNLARRR